MPGELRVVATAGHVDHGKSTLIEALTGMDPDRFAEEKRRGLTIDLGYAWCTLPSGRQVGFVDVPGHERFIANMLAGVGPVRTVVFVVAADEGWKPQSEEHLQILDVLGTSGGVVALTKADLADAETLRIAVDDVREQLAGTGLAGAAVVPVSARTGAGIAELLHELDAVLAAAPPPEDARTRLFVDRVFTIKGAGTIVTGTLTGGCLTQGDDVELSPGRRRARIRSLQSHKREETRVCHVGRVAANLVGLEKENLQRGDVLTTPDAWRPTRLWEGVIRPVRGLGHPITARGAYKVYAGASEVDATIRLYGTTSLEPGGEAFVRVRTPHPLVLDVFDRFVLRDAGRRETVGGGTVLDVAPPLRAGPDPGARLRARSSAARADLPAILTAERGAVAADEALALTGVEAAEGRIGGWLVREDLLESAGTVLSAAVNAFHTEHPLEEGLSLADARRVIAGELRSAPSNRELVDALLDHLTAGTSLERTAASLRRRGHRVELANRSEEVDRLLKAIGEPVEATPPTIRELIAAGIGRDVIDAAVRSGLVCKISPELIFTPALVARAESAVRASGGAGITVSAFREGLGTTRKFAVPLLEWLDQRGVTRRSGDLRFPTG